MGFHRNPLENHAAQGCRARSFDSARRLTSLRMTSSCMQLINGTPHSRYTQDWLNLRTRRSLYSARGRRTLGTGEAARDRLLAERLGHLVERAVEPVPPPLARRRRAEQRELRRRGPLVARQVLHLHAGKAHPFTLAHALEQRPRDPRHFGAIVGRSLQRLAACHDRIEALPKRPRELEL